MRNLTIGKRMGVAFGAIGILILMIIIVTIWGTVSARSSHEIAENANLKARAASDISYQASTMLYNAALTANEAAAGRANSATAQQARQQYQAASTALDEAISQMKSLDLDTVEVPIIQKLDAGVTSYRSTETRVQELLQQGTPASYKSAEAVMGTSGAVAQITGVISDIRSLVTDVRLDANTAEEQAAADASRSSTLTIAVAVLSLILATFLAIVTTRSITRPVGAAVQALDRLSVGDVRVQLDDPSKDELGQMARAMNLAMKNLGNTVMGISRGTKSLEASVERLFNVSQRVSASAEESASQAQSVSAAAEEVSHGVQTVAASAQQLGTSEEEIARNTAQAANIAAAAVRSAEEANETVARLGTSSSEIGAVVNVITSVAEQINLLALNATIEAARAGAAGESFAVVASEVKNLARKTAKSSDEIRAKIEGMQLNSRDAIAAITEITNVIDQISGTQTQVAAAVEEQTAATSDIGRSMNQAAVGSTEIARSITEVAEAAAENSRAATETQELASEISGVVKELDGYVSLVNVGDRPQ